VLSVSIRVLQFLAIIVGALALIPSGAHLAELPNKMGLSQADYFTVQDIYFRWAIFGLLWPVAIIVNVALAILVRSWIGPLWPATLAAFCFVVVRCKRIRIAAKRLLIGARMGGFSAPISGKPRHAAMYVKATSRISGRITALQICER
jgi:hypothetical protein